MKNNKLKTEQLTIKDRVLTVEYNKDVSYVYENNVMILEGIREHYKGEGHDLIYYSDESNEEFLTELFIQLKKLMSNKIKWIK